MSLPRLSRPRMPALSAALTASGLIAFGLAGPPGMAAAETSQRIPAPSVMRTAIEACLDAASAAGGDADGAGARSCVGQETAACIDRPENQTTTGMTACALAERDAWDALLNLWWKPLRAHALKLDEASGDTGSPPAAPMLQEAQRAWLAFRDAECAYDHALAGGGTIRQIYGAECQLRLTAARALRFRERLAAAP